MNPKHKSIFKASGLLTIVSIAFVIGALITMSWQNPILHNEVKQVTQKQGKWFPLGEANLTGTNSGYQTFHIRPHEAAPAEAYATNVTNATAYEYSDFYSNDAPGLEMTGETPWGDTFDFYEKIKVNKTDGWNTSTSQWMAGWLSCNLSVDFSAQADLTNEVMTIVEISNSTDYVWYAAYLNNGGAGYTLAKNEKFYITMDTKILR